MAKLDQIEAERFDFAQHLLAGSMTMGIPGSGKSDHRVSFTRLELVALVLLPPLRKLACGALRKRCAQQYSSL